MPRREVSGGTSPAHTWVGLQPPSCAAQAALSVLSAQANQESLLSMVMNLQVVFLTLRSLECSCLWRPARGQSLSRENEGEMRSPGVRHTQREELRPQGVHTPRREPRPHLGLSLQLPGLGAHSYQQLRCLRPPPGLGPWPSPRTRPLPPGSRRPRPSRVPPPPPPPAGRSPLAVS